MKHTHLSYDVKQYTKTKIYYYQIHYLPHTDVTSSSTETCFFIQSDYDTPLVSFLGTNVSEEEDPLWIRILLRSRHSASLCKRSIWNQSCLLLERFRSSERACGSTWPFNLHLHVEEELKLGIFPSFCIFILITHVFISFEETKRWLRMLRTVLVSSSVSKTNETGLMFKK